MRWICVTFTIQCIAIGIDAISFLCSVQRHTKCVHEVVAMNDGSREKECFGNKMNLYIYTSYFDFTTSLWATYTHRRRCHIRNSVPLQYNETERSCIKEKATDSTGIQKYRMKERSEKKWKK